MAVTKEKTQAKVKTITLISKSKRTFSVDPKKVIKVYKGTREQQVLQTTDLIITPGSIVEVTEELGTFLLTYKIDFEVYGIPLN